MKWPDCRTLGGFHHSKLTERKRRRFQEFAQAVRVSLFADRMPNQTCAALWAPHEQAEPDKGRDSKRETCHRDSAKKLLADLALRHPRQATQHQPAEHEQGDDGPNGPMLTRP